MLNVETSAVLRWSTADVPPASRLDYFASALSRSVAPFVVDEADPQEFHADLRYANLGTIAVIKNTAAAHRSFRSSRELSHTSEHSFNLLMMNVTWYADHRGAMRLAPRDILVHDTRYPLVTDLRQTFTAINVMVTEPWLRHWLANPNVLSTRHISGESPWGRALSAFLSELSPELVQRPPVPLAVLSDQVGSLLALTATGIGNPGRSEYRAAIRDLHASILDCIRQRCTEPQLTAAAVANSVNISLRTLHRTLAAANQTFGAQLIAARVHVAERMLASPLFNRVTTSEIGRRSGFMSASHFARVMRAYTGQTPLQLRHSGGKFGTELLAPVADSKPCRTNS